ncbi:MAG: hypothetical protein J6M36_10160, partial [Prevotella sp.]|nr:hypothetical protein [Prevotella sp.]
TVHLKRVDKPNILVKNLSWFHACKGTVFLWIISILAVLFLWIFPNRLKTVAIYAFLSSK